MHMDMDMDMDMGRGRQGVIRGTRTSSRAASEMHPVTVEASAHSSAATRISSPTMPSIHSAASANETEAAARGSVARS